eukprot:c17597_g1_i1.p1 GENE.c17597_g1_i1~~c17597_g1_i1.p1  ORF type:complete len:266 (-),score=68.64 c17597_g1_i1:136-882(-)
MTGLFLLAVLLACFLAASNAHPVEQQPPAPVYYGKQPLEKFHDMLPPFGMSYQPLSQLPADHPLNQMGKREHVDWAGRYPQQWGDPFPHNSPVDSSRVAKNEEMYPGRAVSPFWWNQPPWWWKQGPWWIQRVKKHVDGQPYGVLGDGPDGFVTKPNLPSPLAEFHSLISNNNNNNNNDVPLPASSDEEPSTMTIEKQNEAIIAKTKFGQRKEEKEAKQQKEDAKKQAQEAKDKKKDVFDDAAVGDDTA